MFAGTLVFINPFYSKPIADAYKLYAHFLIVENSGLVGIPITIFVYLVEIILASSIFYVYFLKIHNNGRLLDTYHRLHGAEEDFLVPYDQEISAKVRPFSYTGPVLPGSFTDNVLGTDLYLPKS